MLKKYASQPKKKGIVKVPTVIQLEALECGAASLDMILAYYGKWIPLEEVRRDCGVSRDGSKAKNILKAARNYGMTADGYRFEIEDLKTDATFPCIIHWNFNHFVVLCGFRGDRAILNDPASGRYSVTMETFRKSYTGICLLFEPTEEFVRSGKPKSVLSFAKKKLTGTGASFALMVITTIITSLIGIIIPGFSNVFTDRLLTGQNLEWFYPFMLGITLLTVVQIIVTWIQAVYNLKTNGKIAITSNADYVWHVLNLPMEFFSQRMAGDIISRKAQNETIASALISTFSPLIIQAFMLIFYMAVMIRYSPLMTLIGVLSVLFNTGISRLISSKRVDFTRVLERKEAKLSSATVSGIEMIESIKATGAENGYFEKWSGYQATCNSGQSKYLKMDTYLGLIPTIVTDITNVLILAGSVWLCMRGRWTVGMISAFIGFLNSFLAPATQLITASQILREMRTSMERIEDVMEYPLDPVCEMKPEAPKEYGKLRGRIELRNVTFGYSPLEEPLIKNLSMTIEAGQSIAFVGFSGCGKSTISKLISGLYQPWSGEILYDGKPLSEIDRNIFRSSVSVVDQDIILFEDTIENNIKMWDHSIEDFEMIIAARDAQIHEDIIAREGGYQCRLTEGGRNLSGGQRQRLEIARVLAEDPTVIIMDEATSALDSKTEYDVVKAIRDRGVTCIVVAHRLSTIRECDRIYVLNNGVIAEQGTHRELYSQGGLYTRLVSS